MRARRVECMERRFKEQSDTLCKLLGNAEQLEAVLQNVRAERSWYLKPYYAARSLRGGRRGHP